MIVYLHDFLGFFIRLIELDDSDKDPEGNYNIPARCVEDAPPEAPAEQVARYVDGAWVLVPDLVGREYWVNYQRFVMEERGVPFPEGAVLQDPGPSPEQVAAARIAQARYALQESDLVALKVFKLGEQYPQEWALYDRALEAIVAGGAGSFPERPELPTGVVI